MEFVPFIKSFVKPFHNVAVIGKESSDKLSDIIQNGVPHIKYVPTDASECTLAINMIKIDLVKIGTVTNIRATFETFHYFLNEGGIIIIDGISDLPSPFYGKHTIFKFENPYRLVVRRDFELRDIRFAIVIATHKRNNVHSSSERYMKRASTLVRNQTYDNYMLFLIGDGYTDEKEFASFASLFPRDKVQLFNNPEGWERKRCKRRSNLSNIGGAYAMNTGIEKAKSQGYKYYIHLDDDDFWHPFHLRNTAIAYHMFPNVAFVETLGYSIRHGILPKGIGKNITHPNNFRPRGCDGFHSSWGFRIDKIPCRYTTIKDGERERDFGPADALMLNEINQCCLKENLDVFCVPFISAVWSRPDGELNIMDSNLITHVFFSDSLSKVNQVNLSLSKGNVSNHLKVLYDLRTLIGAKPAVYMDTNVEYGESLFLMLGHPYQTEIYGIQPVDTKQKEDLNTNMGKIQNSGKILWIPPPGEDPFQNKQSKRGISKIDILFINGTKSDKAIQHFFTEYEKYVPIGGYIVFGGYCNPFVKSTVWSIVDLPNIYHKYDIIGTFPNLIDIQKTRLSTYNGFIIHRTS